MLLSAGKAWNHCRNVRQQTHNEKKHCFSVLVLWEYRIFKHSNFRGNKSKCLEVIT